MTSPRRNDYRGSDSWRFLAIHTAESDLRVRVRSDGCEESAQAASGVVRVRLLEHVHAGHAIQAKTAEILAQATPCAQRPDPTPEREAHRFDVALAGRPVGPGIGEAHEVAALDRFVQRVEIGARGGTAGGPNQHPRAPRPAPQILREGGPALHPGGPPGGGQPAAGGSRGETAPP